jgi:hypothetical protein
MTKRMTICCIPRQYILCTVLFSIVRRGQDVQNKVRKKLNHPLCVVKDIINYTAINTFVFHRWCRESASRYMMYGLVSYFKGRI